ncbi:MAG: hypothetical protein JOZ69_12325 [Myxococcales bacterium]|nr:hypothetical protein [Myxococcales bacterium]
MPDPRILYIVSAFVVLGLIVWVVLVLRQPDAPEPGAASGPGTPSSGGGAA